MTGGEGVELPVPHAAVGNAGVEQDDGRAAAGQLDIVVAAIDRDELLLA